MSSREFAEWMAYYELEPFGEERADLRSAIVASTVANAHRDPKRRRKPFRPLDFMPRFDETKRPKGVESMLNFVEMFNTALGGRDLRRVGREKRD
jgi:hypothetical protein